MTVVKISSCSRHSYTKQANHESYANFMSQCQNVNIQFAYTFILTLNLTVHVAFIIFALHTSSLMVESTTESIVGLVIKMHNRPLAS